MGEGDTTAKEFFEIDANFADCINYAVFGGRRVVQPSALGELDKEEIMRRTKAGGGRTRRAGRSRERDLLRNVCLRQCRGVKYMIVGIENQCAVDCGMAVRCMQYDALRYDRQMRRIIREYRKCLASRGQAGAAGDGGWTLPTLPRGARLKPVVTIVIYWGKGRWDGPRSLHELLDCQEPEILEMAADYRLHLIEPCAMEARDFALFATELGAVLNYVNVQDDPDAMEKLLREDARFRNLSMEALQLLRTVTKTSIKTPETTQDGRVDMCKAEQILMERARQKDWNDGVQKGIVVAMELLIEFGKSAAEIHSALMRKYSIDAEEASRYLALKGLTL